MKQLNFSNAKMEGGMLQRTILHALRHDPWKYGLNPDDEGWLPLEEMLAAFRQVRRVWHSLELHHLEALLATDRDRFEIVGGQVRARYGHSITLAKVPATAVPPENLFHGTGFDTLDEILRHGLQPLGRGFVHLTSRPSYALLVSASKASSLVLLVKARQAHDRGALFRIANDHVWLAESVPPAFIQIARLMDLLERSSPGVN